MSVGVCVINRNGIALAADSAITFNGNQMFYNSMNKVFSLSEKYIYGAITYGGTSLYNVSSDQLLKEFKVFLDSKDCVDDFFEVLDLFIEFLKQNISYYKFDVEEKAYCESTIEYYVSEWAKRVKAVVLEADAEDKINEILEEINKGIKGAVRADGFDVKQYIKDNYSTKFESKINECVPELNKFGTQKEKFWEYLCEYFNLSLTRESQMGLLFAGYGNKDAFPKYIYIELHKVLNGKVKYRLIEKYEEQGYAKIMPLAQKDMILTFCNGISTGFKSYIPQKMEELVCSKIDDLQDGFTDAHKQKIKDVLIGCKKEMQDAITNKIQSDNVTPLFRSVSSILLPEMAFLAESLINITSLKRAYVLDGNQQTVGGATDVAVLSKADGFIWVKRKHHFEQQTKASY